MFNLTTIIQEITLTANAFGIYDYFINERNMSRTDILNIFVEWAKEFEETHKNFDWTQGSFYDEVDDFLSCRFDSIRTADKIRDAFPGGITKGDYISYEGGIFKVTGFSERGILVEEIKPPPENPDWVVLEIAFIRADKVKILPGYEDIIDTTNNHDPELVAKINIAWNEKRELFFPILCALYKRDAQEILDSDAFKFPKYDIEDAYLYLSANWDIEAYNYLQHIADDTDLKCILNYLHAQ
jgi:hypothetical protein